MFCVHRTWLVLNPRLYAYKGMLMGGADPYGVLGPNEIHVKCSRRDFIDQEGRQTDIVLGDVLVNYGSLAVNPAIG